MLAIFGFVACLSFDAGFAWYVIGFLCLLLDGGKVRITRNHKND